MLGDRVAEIGILRALLDDRQFGLEIKGGHMFDEKKGEHGAEQHCEKDYVKRTMEHLSGKLVR